MTVFGVWAPSPNYRAPADAIVLWQHAGTLIEVARARMTDRELLFSVLLSRVTRELRREYGDAAAKAMLQGFVDTMDHAAQGDLPLTPGGDRQ
jgi:hypothetical protein